VSRNVDLHTHSSFSDGTCTPTQLVRLAQREGVEALVLTDHDTVAGLPEALAEARRVGQAFCGGVEINTREGDSVHILGYGFDPDCPRLKDLLADLRTRRVRRAAAILELLQGLGVSVSMEDVRCGSGETIGRPHIADALRRRKVVRSRKDAFRRFLAVGGPAYVPSAGPTVPEAIAGIRGAGGWAVLAHPGLLRKGHDLGPWVDAGLEGIEAYYPNHSRAQTGRFLEAAERYGLIVTGGSDFHGPRTEHDTIGGIRLPDEVYARFESRLDRCPAAARNGSHRP